MFLAPDDAKTDVILVGAVFVFGRAVVRIIADLPGYPRAGVVASLLTVFWIVALTAVVPILLARYRGDNAAAFGLDGSRAAVGPGVIMAVPVAAAGILPPMLSGAPLDLIVFGRLAPALLRTGGPDPLLLVIVVLQVVALAVGVLLAVSFIAVRAREGFPRSPDVPLTQLVRTVGVIAVAAAAVLGLLNALRVRSGSVMLDLVVLVLALALLFVMVDRYVDGNTIVPRATIVAPVVVVTVGYVLAAGGLFRGDLLTGLFAASLATGVTVAIAALPQTRARTWAAVPLVIAAHWWMTPLSPMPAF